MNRLPFSLSGPLYKSTSPLGGSDWLTLVALSTAGGYYQLLLAVSLVDFSLPGGEPKPPPKQDLGGGFRRSVDTTPSVHSPLVASTDLSPNVERR